MIGKIERVPLRHIWKHEAYDFTTWLRDNTDSLNEIIGFELQNVETEKSTGVFSVDIIGEDPAGNSVIIENQLEKSDHDHLGKLITYLSVFDAKVAIWIVANARQEHIQAVSWLNENKDVNFYLIQVEVIKIGDSQHAPLFTSIVEPSDELKTIGHLKQEKSERHKLRQAFWTQLLDAFKLKDGLFSNISPSEYNWIGTSSGLRGVNYSFWLKKDSVSIKLYIDRGKGRELENTTIFRHLLSNKDVIEGRVNFPVVWNEAQEYRVCLIETEINLGGWQSNQEIWDKIMTQCIDRMIAFRDAIQPFINNVKL